ncbi:MAG: phosphatidate cytidylyltransferase [Chitinophagaceae bacterium]|nr:MAG: phosphatidate [Chitinophagaceae bacterium]TXT31205.1 MAG: phosphatidate cytidylyltransferase [Chitinophagaceae bacterium]
MALNIATLKTRALTAIVFVAVMLTGIMYHEWSFTGLFLVIQFGCIFEYLKLIKLIDPSYGKFPLPFLKFFVLGILYLVPPFSIMRMLYIYSPSFFEGPNWVLPMIIIAAIWINDTMAYFVGSLIGKHPLSAISPKKTWEGTIGGAILAVLVISWAASAIWGFSVKYLLAISATAAIAGTFGDLLESKLKRMAGVKDSGQIMPGHGGFLDRFDSLLIATPAVWLVLLLFYRPF